MFVTKVHIFLNFIYCALSLLANKNLTIYFCTILYNFFFFLIKPLILLFPIAPGFYVLLNHDSLKSVILLKCCIILTLFLRVQKYNYETIAFCNNILPDKNLVNNIKSVYFEAFLYSLALNSQHTFTFTEIKVKQNRQ